MAKAETSNVNADVLGAWRQRLRVIFCGEDDIPTISFALNRTSLDLLPSMGERDATESLSIRNRTLPILESVNLSPSSRNPVCG
ncbi:MAG: hypothetical protein WKF84_05585 [Pyrinomonadaceae bacterium]